MHLAISITGYWFLVSLIIYFINKSKYVQEHSTIASSLGIFIRRGGFFQVGNQVPTVFFLPQSSKDHLSSWDNLFGFLQVTFQSLLIPDKCLLLVGFTVVVTLGLTSVASKQSVKVGAHLVPAALLHSVTLRARSPENLLSLLDTHDAKYLKKLQTSFYKYFTLLRNIFDFKIFSFDFKP